MENKARIIITGDTHLDGGRVKTLAENNNVQQLFGDFLSDLKDADLTVTNLESPVTDKGKPIEKTGPNLKSSTRSINVLKSAGIDLVTLANNHIMDYGCEGLRSTLEVCKKVGIDTVGAGDSLADAQKPYFTELNGIKLAVINIAENEFGTTQNSTPGCHPLDPVQNFDTIRNAKKEADKVIVIVHGGHEHYELPSPRMKKTYRFFVDSGADAVIGHHTHCISGYEVYNKAPIFYSLGNFLFDLKNRDKSLIHPWNVGMYVALEFSNSDLEFKVYCYTQNAIEAGLNKLDNADQLNIEENISELNSVIQDDKALEKRFEEFCLKSKRNYSSYIEPHSVRILHALRNRNLLPSLLSKKKKILLLNITRCEAHRDVLIKTLKQ